MINPIAVFAAVAASNKKLLRFRGTRTCLGGLTFSRCGVYHTYNPFSISRFIKNYHGKMNNWPKKENSYAISGIISYDVLIKKAKKLGVPIITEAQFFNLILKNSIESLMLNNRLEQLNLTNYRQDLLRLLDAIEKIPNGLLIHHETTGEVLPGTLEQYIELYGEIIALFLSDYNDSYKCVEDYIPEFLINVRDGIYTNGVKNKIVCPVITDIPVTTIQPLLMQPIIKEEKKKEEESIIIEKVD